MVNTPILKAMVLSFLAASLALPIASVVQKYVTSFMLSD